ncbi:N-acetyltransferase [Rhodobacteraceae bacterium RKSG542]|uniref:GNAT family N-acetyltransferase n=1 Tax=Pseudovibrio flavus TaxID=2529854 RepID=UPI0012BCFE0D|nr:GNAT family N-acetyltransferase [Pseudovibrio flavus]MTI17755.1 N-acetyltransferase [Pseudovibrio flavus]
MTPVITTQRLNLHPTLPLDEKAFWTLGSTDFEVVRWLTGSSWPPVRKELSDHLLAGPRKDVYTEGAAFSILLDGHPIGGCKVSAPDESEYYPELPTLGYWLGRDYHGNGYGYEAMSALIDWSFQTYDMPAIAARVLKENSRSQKLLKKLGFKETGECVRFSNSLHAEVENYVLKLSREDFVEAAL